MMDYSEFKRKAEGASKGKEEAQRLEEDFSLIENNGWENYVTLLAEILGKAGKVDRNDRRFTVGGNCLHLYSLSRVLEPDKCDDYSFGTDVSRSRVFRHELSLGYNGTYNPLESEIMEKLGKIKGIITESVDCSGLYVRRSVDDTADTRIEKTAVSTSPISDEDMETLCKAFLDRTAEEQEEAKKYLVITICEFRRQIS